MNSTSTIDRVSSRIKACLNGEMETARVAHCIATLAKRWWRAYCRWDDRLRQRRHLGALDDRLLADIGVNQMQARREASRWFVV